MATLSLGPKESYTVEVRWRWLLGLAIRVRRAFRVSRGDYYAYTSLPRNLPSCGYQLAIVYSIAVDDDPFGLDRLSACNNLFNIHMHGVTGKPQTLVG